MILIVFVPWFLQTLLTNLCKAFKKKSNGFMITLKKFAMFVVIMFIHQLVCVCSLLFRQLVFLQILTFLKATCTLHISESYSILWMCFVLHQTPLFNDNQLSNRKLVNFSNHLFSYSKCYCLCSIYCYNSPNSMVINLVILRLYNFSNHFLFCT